MKFSRTHVFACVLALAFLFIITSNSTLQAQNGAGSIFQAVSTPHPNFNNGLSAVSASSGTDIWAAGEALMHYDGTAWTAFTPALKNEISTINGVVDISPTLAWAAGVTDNQQGLRGQVIEQWNGTSWNVFPGPQFAAGDEPDLFAVASTSADDIWAIGSLLGDDGSQLFYLFEHYDGTKWTATTQLSGDAFLFGASADATNDAWAVGFNGPENDTSRTLVMHYNGTNWKSMSAPSVGNGANQLNAVLALAPNDVWAVGFSTPEAPPKEVATLTLIEHYDGTSWSVVPSPNVGPNSIYQSNRLLGITANSPTDIYAFGSYFDSDGSGQQFTLLEHWDGTSWTIQPSPNPTKKSVNFVSDLLFAGVVVGPGNIWIVGAEDEAPHEGALAIHTSTGASE